MLELAFEAFTETTCGGGVKHMIGEAHNVFASLRLADRLSRINHNKRASDKNGKGKNNQILELAYT
jgi:hypothetical protein